MKIRIDRKKIIAEVEGKILQMDKKTIKKTKGTASKK